MPPTLPILTARSYGKLTQAAGTLITRLLAPIAGAVTRAGSLSYTNSTTAHLLAIMRPLGKTTVASAAAAAQAVINLTSDPGKYSTTYPGGTSNVADNNISANDFCAYQTADGLWVVDTVASLTLLALTMTTNVPTSGVLAGAPFYFFGISTDTNPADGLPHPVYDALASVVTLLPVSGSEAPGGLNGSIAHPPFMQPGSAAGAALAGNLMNGIGEPIIVQSNNLTAAGTLEWVQAVYATPPPVGP